MHNIRVCLYSFLSSGSSSLGTWLISTFEGSQVLHRGTAASGVNSVARAERISTGLPARLSC